jgi:hypothetical protein
MALEGQEESGQRGAEQLAAERIPDLPEAFEGGNHGGVIVAPPPSALRAPPGSSPKGANRRLPMTASGSTRRGFVPWPLDRPRHIERARPRCIPAVIVGSRCLVVRRMLFGNTLSEASGPSPVALLVRHIDPLRRSSAGVYSRHRPQPRKEKRKAPFSPRDEPANRHTKIAILKRPHAPLLPALVATLLAACT